MHLNSINRIDAAKVVARDIPSAVLGTVPISYNVVGGGRPIATICLRRDLCDTVRKKTKKGEV